MKVMSNTSMASLAQYFTCGGINSYKLWDLKGFFYCEPAPLVSHEVSLRC